MHSELLMHVLSLSKVLLKVYSNLFKVRLDVLWMLSTLTEFLQLKIYKYCCQHLYDDYSNFPDLKFNPALIEHSNFS